MADEKLYWYTLLDGSHSFRGNRARSGEKIQLTKLEAERLGERVMPTTMDENDKTAATTDTVKPTYEPTIVPITQPVQQTAESGSTDSTSQTNTTSLTNTRDWSNTQDMKASDVIDLIDETDSKEELVNLREVEQKGQNRIGVMNAIKKRMGQIGG